MREILFRGKTKEGEWVYGFYIPHAVGVDLPYLDIGLNNHTNADDDISLVPISYQCHTILKLSTNGNRYELNHVLPETVGEYTGLEDVKGNKIFEGDIISRKITKTDTMFKKTTETIITKVVFHNVKFKLELNNGFYGWSYFDNIQEEVIGNIHDNPELLRGDK